MGSEVASTTEHWAAAAEAGLTNLSDARDERQITIDGPDAFGALLARLTGFERSLSGRLHAAVSELIRELGPATAGEGFVERQF